MAEILKPEATRRRRNCIDRTRHAILERQRQRQGSDPAGKIVLQLLAMLSAGLALHSVTRSLDPFRKPKRQASRKANQDFLDEEDRGPTAHAMERGLDPSYYRTSSREAPAWTRLVKDLKRPRSKERASALLEYRVPPEAVEWLRSRIFVEDWLSLRQLGRDGACDDEIAAAALAEAMKWKAAQPKLPEPNPDPEPDRSVEPESRTRLKP